MHARARANTHKHTNPPKKHKTVGKLMEYIWASDNVFVVHVDEKVSYHAA